jgi:hypothetical protein
MNPLETVTSGTDENDGLTDNRMSAALQVLKDAGLINDEYGKQLQQQSGQPVSPRTVVDSVTVDAHTYSPGGPAGPMEMDRSMRSETAHEEPGPLS